MLEQVEALQKKIDEVTEEQTEKVLAIELEYNAILQPRYKERSEAIKKIPEFWLTVLMKHPVLTSCIDERDRDVLRSLTDIHVESAADVKSGYKIVFHFGPNEYFENDVLCKEFKYTGERELECTCTEIKWKPSMDLTAAPDVEDAVGEKRPRGDGDSFFLWFSPEDTETEIADIIKEEIYLDPLQYFFAQDPEEEEAEEDMQWQGEDDPEGGVYEEEEQGYEEQGDEEDPEA